MIVYADNTTGTLKSGDLYCSGEYTFIPTTFTRRPPVPLFTPTPPAALT